MYLSSFTGALALLLLPGLSAAAPQASSHLSKRCEFDSSSSPNCWGKYDIDTNYYEDGPDTGVIREYWFDLVNKTMSVDGVPRMVLSINGTVPGPTIIADWGDTVVVHVRNLLDNNGTSLHFHGIRQNNTNDMDGVAAITQCPTAPKSSMTYKWKATQYGSTWYHSHFQLQAWNGVFGGIVINGPATEKYNEDLGVLMLSDWFHSTADELYHKASTGAPPPANNGLINGTNMFNGQGKYFETAFEAGKSYRIRLVNTAIDTMFRFMIDNHTLTVIGNDLVPIKPYNTKTINVGIGQRYDIIVTANANPGNYWLRSIPQTTCSANDNALNIKGIVRYDKKSTDAPSTSAWAYDDSCADEATTNLVPHLSLDAGDASVTDKFGVGLKTVKGFFKWTLNNNTFISPWERPTLQQVVDGNETWAPEQQVVQLDQPNQWVYFVIENTGLNHPIHLHGHDFWVLGQLPGKYNASVPLPHKDVPRRDVAMLPANGHLVIAFKTDNPGVWLMHCHIGWHTGQGFALQLVERKSEVPRLTNSTFVSDQCKGWNDYAKTAHIVQDDSGI